MSKFESFCKNIHKTKEGHVPDLIDLESDELRDLCMASFIADKCGDSAANYYLSLDEEAKNDEYSCNKLDCQEAIDIYNNAIDDERYKAKKAKEMADSEFIGLIDPDYKYRRFNQAEIDAGFSGTGKEFC